MDTTQLPTRRRGSQRHAAYGAHRGMWRLRRGRPCAAKARGNQQAPRDSGPAAAAAHKARWLAPVSQRVRSEGSAHQRSGVGRHQKCPTGLFPAADLIKSEILEAETDWRPAVLPGPGAPLPPRTSSNRQPPPGPTGAALTRHRLRGGLSNSYHPGPGCLYELPQRCLKRTKFLPLLRRAGIATWLLPPQNTYRAISKELAWGGARLRQTSPSPEPHTVPRVNCRAALRPRRADGHDQARRGVLAVRAGSAARPSRNGRLRSRLAVDRRGSRGRALRVWRDCEEEKCRD